MYTNKEQRAVGLVWVSRRFALRLSLEVLPTRLFHPPPAPGRHIIYLSVFSKHFCRLRRPSVFAVVRNFQMTKHQWDKTS